MIPVFVAVAGFLILGFGIKLWRTDRYQFPTSPEGEE